MVGRVYSLEKQYFKAFRQILLGFFSPLMVMNSMEEKLS